MRVVGIAVIAALLSAGCALQTGDPPPEQTRRPDELVDLSGDSQAGAASGPGALPRAGGTTDSANANSPNPSPWTSQGAGAPHAGNVSGQGGNNADNPNPSPWSDPNDPRWGGAVVTGKGGPGG